MSQSEAHYLQHILESLESEKRSLEADCSILTDLIIRKSYKNLSEFKFLLDAKKKNSVPSNKRAGSLLSNNDGPRQKKKPKLDIRRRKSISDTSTPKEKITLPQSEDDAEVKCTTKLPIDLDTVEIMPPSPAVSALDELYADQNPIDDEDDYFDSIDNN
mmetsp:Transcript_33747/g.34381  ORF Transcript_33747/g.34381 Transcript_33747/m.34381 type:complete len:159 (-) Transcript_33747:35-511(-)